MSVCESGPFRDGVDDERSKVPLLVLCSFFLIQNHSGGYFWEKRIEES